MGDDWLISVPQKRYYTNFTSIMKASATTLFEGGGAYNMKLCTLVEFQAFAGVMATYSSPLYGEDWITFGIRYKRVGQKLDGVVGRMSASVNFFKNSAATVETRTTKLATTLQNLNTGLTSVRSNAIDASITQSVRI